SSHFCFDSSLLHSFSFFFFTVPPPTEITTLSLHDALPIFPPETPERVVSRLGRNYMAVTIQGGRKTFYPLADSSYVTTSTRRQRSEEHTSELQSRFDLVCRLLLEKKKKKNIMRYTSSVHSQ